MLFTTLPGQTEVVVKVINNNQQSGCGNDIAIDEIIVQVCGGASILSSQGYDDNIALFCAEDVPVSLTLNLETFYQGSYFIWQQSTNGSSWVDVGGVTTFNTGGIYSFNANNISSTTYFRVKFASVISNFDSPLTSPDNIRCLWYSNTFMINIFTAGAPSSFSGDPIYCGNSPIPPLAVFPVPGVTVNWYDSPNGGNLLHSNSFNYYPPGPGTYYAEFATSGISCNTERTPFTLTWIPGVELPENPDPIFICGGETVILDAGYENGIYQWEPAWLGNTQTVTVSDPGIYTVTVQNQSNCTDSRTFIIEGYTAPQIVDIFNVGTTVTVIMSNEDTFEYSLDGVFWQTSNIFENVRPGIVTVYVRDVIQCGLDIQEYFLLFPPLFFTPNGDGVNDIFLIEGINRFDLEVMIFDRYGKLLTVLNSNNPYWDGTYRGEDLLSSDYWYSITHNNSVVMKGHFTLKR
ncbi:MAG: T9SS type B sorting domain-containing protein [Flavobacteriaceae bacterium]